MVIRGEVLIVRGCYLDWTQTRWVDRRRAKAGRLQCIRHNDHMLRNDELRHGVIISHAFEINELIKRRISSNRKRKEIGSRDDLSKEPDEVCVILKEKWPILNY